MNRIIRFATILLAFFAVFGADFAAGQEKIITVFAAASMKNALDAINAAFTRRTGIKVAASYAASSALMNQIEQGAPADVFASADLEWMDYGSQKKVIKDDTRVNLLGNRLCSTKLRLGRVSTWPNSRATTASRPAMSEQCRSRNMRRQRWKSLGHGTPPPPNSR